MIYQDPYLTPSNNKKQQWFIKNYIKLNKKTSPSEASRLSAIWLNMITLNCRYPDAIEFEIQNFLKSVKKI